MNFLVCCYFGQSKNLIKAAIDRAYVDMASHTLKGFGNDYTSKWDCRYKASKAISCALKNYPNKKENYKEWHDGTIEEIKRAYSNPELTYGQAQKWLNMTIKYLFVLRQLYGADSDCFESIKAFFTNTSSDDYRVPIDSYVLKGIGIRGTWSNKSFPYDEVEKSIIDYANKNKYANAFEWELFNWENLSSGKGDNKSYSYYCDDKDEY